MSATSPEASTAAANKERVRRYVDAMERGAVDEAVAFWTADAVNRETWSRGGDVI